jgi:hypothetical protein
MKEIHALAALVTGVVLAACVYVLVAESRERDGVFDSGSDRIIRHMLRGNGGEFEFRDEARTIKAKWRGAFYLDNLGADISDLEDRFEIAINENGVKERVEIQHEKDGVTRLYFLDGAAQQDSAETRQKIADLLLRFFRSSAVMAEDRIAGVLEEGGTEAAIQEVGLAISDHARSRHAIALIRQADLSAAQLSRLVEKLKAIEADHSLGRVLAAILEHEPTTAEMAAIVAAGAASLDSDDDLRRLVEAFAEETRDGESLDLALDLFERIAADHDLRAAATALLQRNALNPAQTARLLAAASRRVQNDLDRRMILTEAASIYADGEDVGAAWREAFLKLESSQEKRLALEKVAETARLEGPHWRSLIKATQAIKSSYERRLALESIAKYMDREAALIEVYRDAAQSIDVEQERRLALEAVNGP